MSQLTVVPNGTGASTQHARDGGSSNWSRVTSDDGDGSYVYNQTTGGSFQILNDLYAMGNSGGQVGTIDQLQVNVKARYSTLDPGGTATITPRLRLGTTSYGPSASDLTSAYEVYSYARTTHPGTGQPFSWADVDGHQAGFQSIVSDSGAFSEMRTTYVWSVVTFHLALRPPGPAVVGAPAQQPDLRLHQIMTPGTAAAVPVAAQPAELRLHQLMTPGGPAFIPVVAQPAILQLHLLMTPDGAAIVPVTAEDVALLVGIAPGRDPNAIFDLRLRGSEELAMSLRQAHALFLEFGRDGVIEEG